MIPKKIHYCWFGRREKSELALKCIDTWRKILPDYEIKEWNEDNSNFQTCIYAKEAYDAGKYAFVSDVIRLRALYNEGGIYMDTDVEIIKSLDPLLQYKAVLGFETNQYVSTCLMACQKGNDFFGELLREYDNIHFLQFDGTYDTKTNVKRVTNTLLKYGLVPNNTFQIVKNISVLPKDYFSPKDYYTEKIHLTENSFAIHHFSKSWFYESLWDRVKRKHPMFNKFIHLPNMVAFFLLGDFYERIKNKIKKYKL